LEIEGGLITEIERLRAGNDDMRHTIHQWEPNMAALRAEITSLRAALKERDEDRIADMRIIKAEIERLRAALERMLLEFDFMVEAGIISDVRDDIIFVEARAALTKETDWGAPVGKEEI
jgi:chromosome segregation ATPase